MVVPWPGARFTFPWWSRDLRVGLLEATPYVFGSITATKARIGAWNRHYAGEEGSTLYIKTLYTGCNMHTYSLAACSRIQNLNIPSEKLANCVSELSWRFGSIGTVVTAASWSCQSFQILCKNVHTASPHAPRHSKPYIMVAQKRHAEPYADDLQKRRGVRAGRARPTPFAHAPGAFLNQLFGTICV